MTMVKKILSALILLFIVIQFVPVSRTNPPVSRDFQPEAQVNTLLKRACYDCHSNETVWPWYSYVAPASWLVTHDVKEAREHFNFSEWDKYDDEAVQKIIKEIGEEVEEGEMPLKKYLLLHPEARLSEQDISTIVAWAEGHIEARPEHETD